MYGLELAGTDDAYAAREARVAASDVTVEAPGLAVARGVDRERVRHLAYTHRAAELVGRTDASIESASALLSASRIDRTGSVAVRARDVRSATGISTQETEIELGSVLVDRGFSVDLDDPDHVLCVWFSDETCLLGWQVAESVRDFSTRQPTARPFFQPGSMDPLDARWAVNVAGAREGTRVVDPMCGTGGFLIEAGLVGSDVVGIDAQWKMTRGSKENLAAYVDEFEILRGDATALPLRDDSADGVVVDVPYGRQSKIATHTLADLVSGALGEAIRIAPRAVVVADRSWAAAAEDVGWTVDDRFERRVHGSLTRHTHVLRRE